MTNASESLGSPVDRSGPEDAARLLLEGASTHAIFMLDADGVIETWSPPASALYGHDAEAVLGERVRLLFADDEDDPDANSPPETFFEDSTTETVEFEHWHRQADGSVFWGTLTLSPLWDDTLYGYVAISQDTTTAKEYERMLERQNDRLKEFTDILAHDLRNPLNIIDGTLALFEDTGDEKHLETIDETTDRMTRLVDDLLRVARQGDVVTDPEPTDIGDLVDRTWVELNVGPGATLQHEPVRSVSSDPDRLRELFENLFANAVEHGPPEVTVRVGPLDTGFFVADDGPGVTDENKDQVFDHGFTTSDDGHGYGLSVVRTIVNAHGWDIAVVDGRAGGARFEVTGIDLIG